MSVGADCTVHVLEDPRCGVCGCVRVGVPVPCPLTAVADTLVSRVDTLETR